MIHLFAQAVSQEQQPIEFCFYTTPDPLVVAFGWATWLLGAFCAVQLVLHAILCARSSSSVLGGTARPVVVLKVTVLYFVASLIVGLYNAIESLPATTRRGSPLGCYAACMKRTTIDTAIAHLRSNDKTMCRMIDDVGPFTLKLQRDRFAMLVRSIISQQISTGAARSIRQRVEALAGDEGVTPAWLVEQSPDELRTAGISAQKAKYMLDLAHHVNDGRVALKQIGRHCDAVVIEKLTAVKGIGEWTAQMFLMFALGRPDVFPHADLGVRTAIRNRYKLDELPDKATSHEIAAKWRPFASVASWYCWRSLDVA